MGKFLLVGFIFGVFLVVVYGLLIIGMVVMIKGFGFVVIGFMWKECLVVLLFVLLIFVVVLMIILFVYNLFGGDVWGMLIEGGVIGVFVVFFMVFYCGMWWSEFKDVFLEMVKFSVMIFIIIWGVLIYVCFFGFVDLFGVFLDWLILFEMLLMLILICILLVYVVLGMFMDVIGMLLLILFVVYFVVMVLNGGVNVVVVDSMFGMLGFMCVIWFGILVVKMVEFCLIMLFIGLNCFVVVGVCDDISV